MFSFLYHFYKKVNRVNEDTIFILQLLNIFVILKLNLYDYLKKCLLMHYYKKILIASLLILSSQVIKAQIGIDFIANKNKFTSWNDVIYEYSENQDKIFEYSFGGGINYWFRLRDFRLEFTPGVYYLYSDFKLNDVNRHYKYISHIIGIEFDANVYPFDFIRRTYERDCPSFSNGNDWLKKSFFVQFSPGIFGVAREIKDAPEKVSVKNIAGKFDFGIGVDMKLTRHLIVAPILKYGLDIGDKWDGFSEFHGEKNFNDGTSNSYLSLTLAFYLK